MQGNVFGLQDPHRLTTVAFDSVGTSILVLDDKAKVIKFLKNKNSTGYGKCIFRILYFIVRLINVIGLPTIRRP